VQGEAAGVDFRVRLAKRLSEAERTAVAAVVSGALERVSEESRLRLPGAGVEVPISPDTLAMLQEAVRVRELTGGAFDLALDDDSMTAAAAGSAVELDLTELARSHAVDRAAAELEELGYRDYCIESGPFVRTRGRNSADEAWRAPIPNSNRQVPLSGFSLATASSDDGGQVLSLTVLGDSCLTTGALAAGLLRLGPDEGFRMAVAQDVAAMFLVRGEEGSVREQATPAFTELYG
jgi:thiamine biosynthesis lipoprotein